VLQQFLIAIGTIHYISAYQLKIHKHNNYINQQIVPSYVSTQ